MGAVALLLGLSLATATAGDHLAAGVAQYESGNNQAALGLLLAALDAKGTRAERGKARLYIGLIQHEAGSVKDAEGSFELALRLSARLRLPARASRAASNLFNQVRDRLGIKARVRKSTRRRTTAPPPPPDPNVLQPLDARQRAALSSGQNTRPQDPAPPPGSTGVGTTVAPTPDDSIPTSTWIIGSTGAVAVVAAVVLSALATSATNSAYATEDVTGAADKQRSAKALHTASVASFATGGLLFGAAALTLVF